MTGAKRSGPETISEAVSALHDAFAGWNEDPEPSVMDELKRWLDGTAKALLTRDAGAMR